MSKKQAKNKSETRDSKRRPRALIARSLAVLSACMIYALPLAAQEAPATPPTETPAPVKPSTEAPIKAPTEATEAPAPSEDLKAVENSEPAKAPAKPKNKKIDFHIVFSGIRELVDRDESKFGENQVYNGGYGGRYDNYPSRAREEKSGGRGYGLDLELGKRSTIMLHLGRRLFFMAEDPFSGEDYQKLIGFSPDEYPLKEDSSLTARITMIGLSKYFLLGRKKNHAILLGAGFANWKYSLKYSADVPSSSFGFDSGQTGLGYTHASHDDGVGLPTPIPIDVRVYGRETLVDASAFYFRLGYTYFGNHNFLVGFNFEGFESLRNKVYNSNDPDKKFQVSSFQFLIGAHF